MEFNRLPIYDMSSGEFEGLCFELLLSMKEVKSIEKYKNNQRFDFYGEIEGSSGNLKTFVAEVKHWSRFSIRTFKEIVLRYESSDANKLIFITSAKITDRQRQMATDFVFSIASDIEFCIMDYNDVLKLVNENIKIGKKYFKEINSSIRTKYLSLTFSIISIIVAILSIFLSFSHKEPNELNNRINKVTESINNLNSLENDLNEIRNDMIEMEAETKLIKEEYARAKKLEQITDDEITAIAYALNKKSIWQTIVQNIPGFIIGIATSVIGSIIFDTYKKRRRLFP